MTSTQKALSEFDQLLGAYWDAAYVEGTEGRTHDTFDYVAANTLAALHKCFVQPFLQVEQLQQERDTLKRRFDGLRELMGYVQNGSDTTVKLFQDDATMDFMVISGNICGYGRSFETALDEAIAQIKED